MTAKDEAHGGKHQEVCNARRIHVSDPGHEPLTMEIQTPKDTLNSPPAPQRVSPRGQVKLVGAKR